MTAKFILTLMVLMGSASAQTLRVSYNQKTVEVDVAKLPHSEVKITDYHSKKERTFTCVALSGVLAAADVPKGETLRGPAMSLVVIVKAKDNYRALFSLAELDESLGAKPAFVCDQESGKPLPEKQAPFQLIVPSDKHPSRSIRMLAEIVVQDGAGAK